MSRIAPLCLLLVLSTHAACIAKERRTTWFIEPSLVQGIASGKCVFDFEALKLKCDEPEPEPEPELESDPEPDPTDGLPSSSRRRP